MESLHPVEQVERSSCGHSAVRHLVPAACSELASQFFSGLFCEKEALAKLCWGCVPERERRVRTVLPQGNNGLGGCVEVVDRECSNE